VPLCAGWILMGWMDLNQQQKLTKELIDDDWIYCFLMDDWKNDELMIPQMRWWVDSCFVGEPCFLIFNLVFVLFWSYMWFLVVSRPPSLRRCFYNSWQDTWRAPRILGWSWWRAGYGLTTPLQLRWNPTIEASWFYRLGVTQSTTSFSAIIWRLDQHLKSHWAQRKQPLSGQKSSGLEWFRMV